MHAEKQQMKREFDPKNAQSIFHFSYGLLHKSLAEAVKSIDSHIKPEDITFNGKGGLGQLVEKFYYGYEPNNRPEADFPEAGIELKTTPLKKNKQDELLIKERLVCDMIDFCEVVKVPFEKSLFYKKSVLMLILFYLHVQGEELRNLKFLFSVLWQLKDKDLLIIKHDYETIINKIKEGKAHELSEGDTMYLGACRKGQKGDPLRKQPFSDIGAPKRAFSLKPAYMRTILEFVRRSNKDMATNTDIPISKKLELVSELDLATSSFEDILTKRIMKFKNQDYKQIARNLGMKISSKDKSRYARTIKSILSKNLNDFNDAEEFQKAGIIAKTIRLEINGNIKENMSFENIDYDEVFETDEWTESRWYEIATSRFMFVIFRAVPSESSTWKNETRYILDKAIFWTMPVEDLKYAEKYWKNIRANVLADTLQDANNTFWKKSDKSNFHVRPKAQTNKDKYRSPVSNAEVPKKAYWFNNEYVEKIVQQAYGKEWKKLFERAER